MARQASSRGPLRIGSILLGATMMIGAAPAAAPQVSARADAIHRRLLTLDTHLDTPMNFARPEWDFEALHSAASDIAQVDLPRMRSGGLDGGFFAIYTAQGPRTPAGFRAARDAAILRAVRIRELAARLPERVELALTARDAARIAASGRIVMFQSIENAYPLSGDVTLLETFHRLGVRMVGVAHFLNNDFGDSATDPHGPEWHGLSPLGRRLVEEANRLGIILDASHSSDEVFDQLIASSRTPIILSHSGCKAVYDHPRNLDDARLRKLAAAGGVIQIAAFGDYLAPATPSPERDAALRKLYAGIGDPGALTAARAADFARERAAIRARYPGGERSFEQFMAHLLHALRIVGPDHVGIGIDWDGGGGVIGLEDVSKIPRITQALLDAGYSEADLQKIWSGNVLRLLQAAQEAAAPTPRASGG